MSGAGRFWSGAGRVDFVCLLFVVLRSQLVDYIADFVSTKNSAGSLRFLLVPCGFFWFFVFSSGSLWFLVVSSGSSWFLMAPCSSLWFLVVSSGSLWFLLVPCDFFWFLVVFSGSLWFLLVRGHISGVVSLP